MQLEVLDLEICHFVQYRPANPPFEPMELNVTIVQRNREWFESNLPLFQKFISDLDRLKNDLNHLSDKYPSEIQDKPQRKKIKLRSTEETPCLIQNEIQPLPKCIVIN